VISVLPVRLALTVNVLDVLGKMLTIVGSATRIRLRGIFVEMAAVRPASK